MVQNQGVHFSNPSRELRHTHAAEVLQPLYAALKGKPPPKEVDWTPAHVEAFEQSKKILADATMLVHPADGAPTRLHVDASKVALGAVLEQLQNGS